MVLAGLESSDSLENPASIFFPPCVGVIVLHVVNWKRNNSICIRFPNFVKDGLCLIRTSLQLKYVMKLGEGKAATSGIACVAPERKRHEGDFGIDAYAVLWPVCDVAVIH